MEERQIKRLIEICGLAAKEQDPIKFHALVQEMNDIFEAKERRLETAEGNPLATRKRD